MRIKGAIFDCDGTLMDSMWAWDNIGGRYLETLGVMPQPGLREKIAVRSLYQAAVYLKEEYGLAYSLDEIQSGMNSMVENAYFTQVQPKPGVAEFLEGMRQRGVPMIIATATDRYLISAALKRVGLRSYFTDIVTCNIVAQGKNKPAVYERCLEILGTKKEETPVFEDALYAMQTAKAAGFPLVGVEDRKTHLYKAEALELCDLFVEDWRKWSFDWVQF